MKKFIIILLLCSLYFGVLYAEKIVDLKSIYKPNFLAVDDERFYVVQGAEVYVYLKEGFRKIAVFGKEGEGPGEFNIGRTKRGVFVYPQKDNLIVHSIGKISIYSFKGEFIKSFNTETGSRASRFKPMNDDYVSMVLTTGASNDTLGFYLSLLDSNMKKKRDLYKIPFIKKGRLEFPFIRPEFRTHKNKIYIIDSKGDGIAVLNRDGRVIKEIKPEYVQRKVTKIYKDKIFNFFKTNPATRGQFELIKKAVTFNTVFPAIQNFWISEKSIYMLSTLEKKEKFEFYIYNLDGKLIKTEYINVSFVDPTRISPSAVYKNSFFQLKEGDDNWEIHKTDF